MFIEDTRERVKVARMTRVEMDVECMLKSPLTTGERRIDGNHRGFVISFLRNSEIDIRKQLDLRNPPQTQETAYSTAPKDGLRTSAQEPLRCNDGELGFIPTARQFDITS